MKLSYRFTLFFSVLLVSLLGAFSYIVHAQVRANLLANAERTLIAHLQHDSHHVAHSHGEIHRRVEGDSVYLRFWKNGELIEDSLPPALVDATDDRDRFVTKRIAFIRDGYLYQVEGLRDLTPTIEYLRTLRTALIVGCLLSLLVIVPFGLLSTRFLLSPFRSLASRTKQVDAQHLSFRFPEPRTRDEYGTLTRNFNMLLHRLDSSFEQVKRFATNASHELRTPLAVIIGQAEMALRRSRTEAEHREVTEKILQQGKYLRETINRMLLLADIERTSTASAATEIPVGKAVNEVLDSLSYAYQLESRNIVVKQVDSDLRYRGNEVILRTVLCNLLENAVKYSRANIILELSRSVKSLRCRVEDDGPGIPPDAREKIFEPFVRAVGKSGVKGHGLGLSIVKTCVETCRGAIHLDTSSLGGLSIEVVLPEPV